MYILYPGVIYGPGNLNVWKYCSEKSDSFFEWKDAFWIAAQAWSYVFVQDVVNGFVKVIEGTPPSNRYILGGENHLANHFTRPFRKSQEKNRQRLTCLSAWQRWLDMANICLQNYLDVNLRVDS